MAGAEQGDCLFRAGMFGARFLQFCIGLLAFGLDADALLDHFDVPLVYAFGGSKPRHRLVACRARRARIGAFDGKQRRARLDHLARLHQYGNDAPSGGRPHRGLRLRAKGHASGQRNHIGGLRSANRFDGQKLLLYGRQFKCFSIRRDARLGRRLGRAVLAACAHQQREHGRRNE